MWVLAKRRGRESTESSAALLMIIKKQIIVVNDPHIYVGLSLDKDQKIRWAVSVTVPW